MKKAALFNPYLDVLGGGEKYILSLLKVLEEQNFQIDIFWDKNLKEEIKQRFNLSFSQINFIPNIFQKANFFKKIKYLKKYDYFFYITDGSYFFSSAKKNFIYAMVPKKNLYQLNILNRLKLFNWHFFTHSFFNQKNLKKWGIEAKVLYPYIDNNFFTIKQRREKIILTVGRFFPQLHHKQHQKMIEIFVKMKNLGILSDDFKLILAGALKDEDRGYFRKLKKTAQNNPSIFFKINLKFDELLSLYQKATFFWHFTGYGIDEEKNPEKVEHLGIAPLEAMASGCLTFCYQAGGPKELIKDKINGFLFCNEKQLIQKMKEIINNKTRQEEIKKKAKKFIENNFSYQVFKKNVVKLIQ